MAETSEKYYKRVGEHFTSWEEQLQVKTNSLQLYHKYHVSGTRFHDKINETQTSLKDLKRKQSGSVKHKDGSSTANVKISEQMRSFRM